MPKDTKADTNCKEGKCNVVKCTACPESSYDAKSLSGIRNTKKPKTTQKN